MRALLKWWRRRQRELDLEILWPACLEYSTSLDEAKAAFAMHAFNDRAWTSLGEAEIIRRIEALQ
jgi:hypothetical protein